MMPHAAAAMVEDLNTSVSLLQSAVAIVSLVAASLYLTTSKLGDRFGTKRIFRIGASLFAAGSLSAVFAQDIVLLIGGWSVVRGIGSGLMYPTGLALIVSHYKDLKRDFAFAMIAIVLSMGAFMGPLLMGTAVTFFSWRLPFAWETALALGMLLLTTTMRETQRYRETQFDPGSILLSIFGIGCLILGPILVGQELDNVLPIAIAVTFLGLVLLLILIWRTIKLQKSERQSLIRLSLFTNKPFVTGWLILCLIAAVNGGILFSIPVFLQFTLEFTALQSAYTLTTLSIGVIVGGAVSAWLTQQMSNRRLMQLATTIIVLALTFIYLNLRSEITTVSIAAPLILLGFGVGIILAQAINISLSAAAHVQRGEASGLSATGQEVFYGLGVAVFGSILISQAISLEAMRINILLYIVIVLSGIAIASLMPNELEV